MTLDELETFIFDSLTPLLPETVKLIDRFYDDLNNQETIHQSILSNSPALLLKFDQETYRNNNTLSTLSETIATAQFSLLIASESTLDPQPTLKGNNGYLKLLDTVKGTLENLVIPGTYRNSKLSLSNLRKGPSKHGTFISHILSFTVNYAVVGRDDPTSVPLTSLHANTNLQTSDDDTQQNPMNQFEVL